jgi:CheY-like chemotaxis protein
MARILVVNSDPAVHTILRAALEGAGHEVWEAHNGNGAAPESGPGRPADLLLCDLCVPGTDGAGVLRSARQASDGLPVLALVAGAFDDPANLRRLARAVGASRVVPKPFRVPALLEAVEEATRSA